MRQAPELKPGRVANFWSGYDEGIRDACETIRGAVLKGGMPLNYAKLIVRLCDNVQGNLTGLYGKDEHERETL